MDDLLDVAIVGGGAAGVLLAIHLLGAGPGRVRLRLIEPRAALGLGAAYSTTCPEHLLNVIARRMSAFEADPGHFVRYLQAVTGAAPADDALPNRFAQRQEFGCYLRSTLEALAPLHSLHVRDEVIDVAGEGPYTLELLSGRRISARTVVLATGNFPRSLPLPAAALSGSPPVDNAWDYAAIRSIPASADLCILGSGLSMVDAVITLAESGHRGAIHVVSRHGLMPLPHARPGAQTGDISELLPLNVRERLRTLRGLATKAMQAGEPWQWTMDRLRPHGEVLWQSLGADEQRRFLRHAVRFWDIHRHRIAPEVAARLDALRAGGQLHVHAGHVHSIRQESRCSVDLRLRKAGSLTLQVDRVINSTGVETRLRHMPSPLMQRLLARGIATAGPHGIGLATTATGALRDAAGSEQSHVLTLGAARIGQSWESIAIPELRRQAQQISEYLLPLCSGHADPGSHSHIGESEKDDLCLPQ